HPPPSPTRRSSDLEARRSNPTDLHELHGTTAGRRARGALACNDERHDDLTLLRCRAASACFRGTPAHIPQGRPCPQGAAFWTIICAPYFSPKPIFSLTQR